MKFSFLKNNRPIIIVTSVIRRMGFLQITSLIFILLIVKSSALAQDDVGSNNSISGKFFEYVNGLRSALLSEDSLQPPSTNTSLTVFARMFPNSTSLQESYKKFLEQVKRVGGMLQSTLGRSNNNNGTQTDINDTIVSGVNSNRSGRNNFWSWSWTPNPNPSPITFAVHPTTTPRSRNPFNRIFLGHFERDRVDAVGPAIVDPYSKSQYYPSNSDIFGRRGHPNGDSSYNFGYPYKSQKPSTVSDIENHTTTTIYIICICLVIMLVGTILFAFASKCQKSSRTATANGTSRRRRRNNSTSNSNTRGTAPPEISIPIPLGLFDNASAPPPYKNVAEPPPKYETLFPDGITTVKQ